ncbi:MAG: hypothetical protein E7654_05945 [Ruminococcaceae bacterium]|nr:hypothetical protein [Oscillospiraceae bacterium]
MKKMFALCLTLVLLLSACGPAAVGDPAVTTDAGTGDAVTTAPQPMEITGITVGEEITSLGGDSRKILRYPVAEGVGTETLNAQLKHHAEKVYAVHATGALTMLDEGETFNYEVTSVEIKRFDEEILSFLCRAAYTSPVDGTEKQIVYTGNLNPETGESIAPEALVTDWGALADLLRAGKSKLAWGSAELLEQMTWDDLLLQIKPAYDIYPAVCFGESGVEIGFEVLPMFGGTAGFTVTYADAADCLAISAPRN